MHKIVLARYTESLDWIVHIPETFEIYIYNKGPEITQPAVIKKAHHIVNRPNEGRESETYLYHMLVETENDDDFTVYAQGDPFTHSPDFLRLLQRYQEWDDLQPLAWQWRADRNIPPSMVLNDYEQQLKGRLRVRPERFSLYTWNPLEFYDEGAYANGRDYRIIHGNLNEGINIASHFLSLARLPEMAKQAEENALGIFAYGAIFAARNSLVKELPVESAKLLYKASLGHRIYGYILERMWLHLFGAEFELPKTQPAKMDAYDSLEEPHLVSHG